MAKQYNKTTFVGHLGSDPEMRYTPKGKPYTSFSVASNDQYTNENGETIKITTWYRCISWGKVAEVHNQYLHKGSKVLIPQQVVRGSGLDRMAVNVPRLRSRSRNCISWTRRTAMDLQSRPYPSKTTFHIRSSPTFINRSPTGLLFFFGENT